MTEPLVGLVSGRTYKRTRERGFAPWKPQTATRLILDQVLTVLDEYQAYLPLTGRQVFYRLVGNYGYDKTEKAYDRLLEYIKRARRAGIIDWEAIRDDGITYLWTPGYSSIADFWQTIRAEADGYQLNPKLGQPVSVEVWVEAAGMVPMIARIAHEYGADVFSCGGFDSVTAKYDTARRIAERSRPTTVLHIGDLDPSGWSIVDSAAEDVWAFVEGLGGTVPTVTRLAVTEEQVRRYSLPTAPQKSTDQRGEQMDRTVQAEALSPDQLEAELRAGLEQAVDLDILATIRAQGLAQQDQLRAALDEIGDSW